MNRKIILFITIIVIFVIAALIILPPSNGKIPAFKDEKGNMISNSIFEKKWIDVDSSKIGLIIVGKNKDNPVLLVCGGGPGIPEYLLESLYPSVLTKHFTVVYFDYPGTGLSYTKVNVDDMTTQLFLNDVDKITDYLLDRFNTNKIYLMGHSFGSYIALNAAYNHPEKYEAYLAVSQIVNTKQSEYMAYDYMISEYEKQNNKSMVKKLKKYPVKESDEVFENYKKDIRDKAMHELGVGTARNMNNVITGLFFPSLKNKAYTIKERINIWKGKSQANKYRVHKDSMAFNAYDNISELKVPVYFFAGKYDYTCVESLQKEYYEFIKAPKKRYYLYENSAHSPVYEEYDITDKYIKDIKESR